MLNQLASSVAQLSSTVLTATVLLGFAAQAHGFGFSGTASGSWGLPTNPSGSTLLSDQNGGTNNRLEWGRTDGCGGGCTLFNNYVQYDSVAFSAPVGSLFNLGNLSYQNGSTWDTFDGDFPLAVSLALDSPTSLVTSFNFLFNIFNSPNVTGDPVVDGDKLLFSNAGLSSQSFTYEGVAYTLKLVGFSTDGGNTLVGEFNSPEGTVAHAALYGIIEEVPEPITVLGSLAAVGFMGAARRYRGNRKKTKV